MRKKSVILLCFAAVVLLAGMLTVPMLVGSRPFHNLRIEDVASIEITLRPPDETIQITQQDQIEEIVNALRQVVIYEKSDEWREYNGQYVAFMLLMKSGKRTEVAAYNPFVILDGQGYKTKYEPCETLNRLANGYLSQLAPVSKTEDLEALLGVSIESIHERFGEPTATLSGFWGEIYQLDDDMEVIIYYDADGMVNLIRSGDRVIKTE